MTEPLLARFAWHDLPLTLQPTAVLFAARAIHLVEAGRPDTELRALLAERHATLIAATGRTDG